MKQGTKELINDLPSNIGNSEVLKYLHTYNITYSLFKSLNTLYHNNVDRISSFFNLTPRTYRNYITKYKDARVIENDAYKEKGILLVSLFKHGINVFGNENEFLKWLEQENYFLDTQKPYEFLNTVSGIQLVNNRLTAIKYGDNV